jgi:hypothetical protein
LFDRLERQSSRYSLRYCELTYNHNVGSGFLFFVFLIAAFFAIVIFIPRLISHITQRAVLRRSISNQASAEQFTEAIHESVKRYKNLHQSKIGNTFYWTAHSKRYSLSISLTVAASRNKYVLKVNLEGNHKQNFTLERPNWLSSKVYNMESKLYFFSEPLKDAEISRLEIEPFVEQLNFFDEVKAAEGILSATRTLQRNSPMDTWPQALATFIRLGSFLMDTGLRKEILSAKDILCPYCRSDFSEAMATVSCRDCKTRHHQECWDEVGRCSVFGCNCKSEVIVTQI